VALIWFASSRQAAGGLRFAGALLSALGTGALTLQAQREPAAELSRPDFTRSLVQRQPLVVGAANDGFPYAYTDPSGRLQGFSTELLDAVARVMNLSIRREVDASQSMQERFRKGEFDLMQAYSQASDRDSYTDFSVPYLMLQGAIFVQKKDSPIHAIADFSGRNFAIIGTGSVGETFLRDHGLRPSLIPVNSTAEGLALVDSGACSGVFVSRLTALSVIGQVGLKNVVMFGEPIADYDIRHCIAVHKGDAQLLARLNEGLAILHRTGEFDRIYRRWFGRFEESSFTREQVVAYVVAALAFALVAAVGGLLRQRALRHRIAGQAAQLAEKEALLQALYDNIPMAMCVLEAAPGGERVLALNRQAEVHCGLVARQAVGCRIADLHVEREWAEHLAELLRRWPAMGGLVREERRLTGARKHVVFTLVPLAPGAAGQARLCVLAEDVSERRQLDEEIAQTRKLRAVGELVGGIAHEFNNLLTPVMLKAGEIQLDWADDLRLQQEVSIIILAVQRAAELTRRLLTFGRKGESRVGEVRLHELTEGCFALLRQTVDRRILWENVVPTDLPPLWFNATDLNQVLLNLLINARDTLLEKLAGQPAGWTPCIRVEAKALPGGAAEPAGANERRKLLGWQQLSVRDNGLGLAPAVQERIFEPFYTTKEVGKGTGLGLATVWHLVTESGGRVAVDSVPGEGSVFRVLLPVWPAPPEIRLPAVATVVASGGVLRVFLAEDEALVSEALATVLRRAGHHVMQSDNGTRAWEHLEGHLSDYDLLVFDVNMPGLDGIELARRARSAHYLGRLMIVSGRLSVPELRELERVRVDRVLAKPFSPPEFLDAVGRCVKPAR
jgi:two-component system cell cycle sensor histidine kinase/response regulator CckA